MNGSPCLRYSSILFCATLGLATGLPAQFAGPGVERSSLERLNAEINRDIVGFKHDPYVETTPLEPLEPRWRESGFIPFARAYGRSVYPNTVPSTGERGAALESFACPGEEEPLVLGVRALSGGLTGLRITVGGLVCLDTTGYIPPDSLAIGVVEFARVRWGEGSDARGWRWHPARIWPWNEYPGTPFSYPDTDSTLRLIPNTTQHFWIRVHTPADAPAGKYAGSLLIESRQGYQRAELRFTVLPLPLAPGGLPPCGVFIPGPQDPTAIADLAAHGINSVARWFDPARIPAVNDRGNIAFDFTQEDYFISRLSAAGIDRPQILFAGNPGNSPFDSSVAAAAGIMEDSPGYLTAYAQAVQSLTAHALKQGWPRQVWGIFDKLAPGKSDTGMFAARARALRRVLGQRINLVSPVIGGAQAGLAADLAPYVNVWLLGEELEVRESMKDLAVWGFIACTQRHSPYESRSRAGFIPWQKALDGVFIWAYNWPGGGHSWNDFDASVMDWMLSYRDINDRYLPTPAWEGVREGLEDRRYLLTLQNLIAHLPANSPVSAEAGALLEALRSAPLDSPGFAAGISLPEEAPGSNDSSPAGLARRALAGMLIRLSMGG